MKHTKETSVIHKIELDEETFEELKLIIQWWNKRHEGEPKNPGQYKLIGLMDSD